MEVDKSNLRSVILNSVSQVNAPLTFFNELHLARRPFNKILICGMGGSALMGDFFSYFQDTGFAPLAPSIPIFTHRSYDLPGSTDQNTLVICVSYSGQTEETLSAFNKAKESHFEVAGITGNGQLAELFQKYKTPWVKIPQNNIPPRTSLGYQLAAMVKILMAYGLLNSSAQSALASLPEKIIPMDFENQARILCAKLNHKIPVIYSSQDNRVLAQLWKICLNENAKIPAFYNFFPELNHNEMVGWTKDLGSFCLLFLRDQNDLPRIKKRMTLTAELLQKQHLSVESIEVAGRDALEKIFWATAFGNWLSYHLALFYGIDPTPVEMVEELKKRLRE
ncbi:bifunctional phosphoglucose/phosphomannose isomerase [Patescibacteria group bacterium]|nr:bifunctional phosphoglucose/phosphomannose isomerase [Patescibacteria group bacterium]MBU4142621.1 bifunctional phosphoglucose/phosphomannose isomerase [Patescibacteria group bacterium]